MRGSRKLKNIANAFQRVAKLFHSREPEYANQVSLLKDPSWNTNGATAAMPVGVENSLLTTIGPEKSSESEAI